MDSYSLFLILMFIATLSYAIIFLLIEIHKKSEFILREIKFIKGRQ